MNCRAAQAHPNGHAGGGAGAAAVAAATGLVSFVGAAARFVEDNNLELVDLWFFSTFCLLALLPFCCVVILSYVRHLISLSHLYTY